MHVQVASTHTQLNLGVKEFESDYSFFEYLTKNGYFKTEEQINCHHIWIHHTGKQCCYQVD